MKFSKKYFTSGNYEDYLERFPKYRSLSKDLLFLKRKKINKVLDFGCGVGFLTMGLREQGFDCVGYDKSKWAADYSKKINANVTNDKDVLGHQYDCVFMLDVLEHNSLKEIRKILSVKTKFLVVRIPVKRQCEKNYYLAKSRRDKTHITCMSKKEWIRLFMEEGYVELSRIKKKTIWDSTGVYCAFLEKQ